VILKVKCKFLFPKSVEVNVQNIIEIVLLVFQSTQNHECQGQSGQGLNVIFRAEEAISQEELKVLI